MRNKLIIVLLVIIGLYIGAILMYPEFKEYIKIKDDHKYYQMISGIKDSKLKEEENLTNNVSELDSLNTKTNELKSEIERINKIIKEKTNNVNELDKKIKNIENRIKNGEKEKNRIKAMFE